jgi:hypothetical protein
MAMGYDPDFQDLPVKGFDGLRVKGEPTPPVKLWTVVYVANLPFPAFMGFLVSYGPGLLGMAMGVVSLYVAGRRACRGCPWAARTVSYGGVAVAVAQLFPLLQLFAGIVGVGAAYQARGRNILGGSTLDPAGALIATIVTGLLLIACAGVVGLVGRAVRHAASSLHPDVEGEWTGPAKP